MLWEVQWPSCLDDAVWMMQLALPHIILFSRDQFVWLQLQSTASFRQARALIRSMSHLKPPGSEAKAANSKATARLLSCWRAAAGLHLPSHMTSEMLEAKKKKKRKKYLTWKSCAYAPPFVITFLTEKLETLIWKVSLSPVHLCFKQQSWRRREVKQGKSSINGEQK